MNRPLIYLLAALGLVVAGAAAYTLGVRLRPAPAPAGTVLQNPVDVGGVALVDGDGRAVTLGDFAGDVVLVYFGYTRCPDVCPLTMARLAKAYRDAGAPDGLDVVMITVDPAYDTPDVVGPWVRHFDPAFIGLTGSNRQIAEAASTFFVGYRGDPSQGVQHTDVVAVVDRHGRLRMIYGQDNVVALEDDLRGLLARRDF